MASKTKLEDLDLSQEEIKRLGEALKDEKFRELFREYAEEISDPENRRRYEEEISQMERERGMDVTFIRPEPGYVLKSSVDGDKKAFINISKSDKIDKPYSERKTNAEGKNGLMWHIPHSFAPPREDFDKQKNRCQVYDFVIHPDTYRMAEKNVRFQKLVEDTAIDGIEKQFSVTFDRKNIKRPKMQFKGIPSATVVRHRNAKGPEQAPDASGLLNNMPYPYDNKTTTEKMKEREQQVKTKEKKESASKCSEQNDKDGATVPKYTIVHRSEIDMAEYRNAPDAKPSTRPRALVIRIELPLLNSAGQVKLDLFEKRLLLESKEPAAYKLDLSLPYPVDDSEGSAKFEKQKRVLVVILPVIPDKSSIKVPFVNGNVMVDAAETIENESSLEKPLIVDLTEGVNSDHVSAPQNHEDKSSVMNNEQESAKEGLVQESNAIHSKKEFSPQISYTLPDFTFTQDVETVSFVLKVKNVSTESIVKNSSVDNEILFKCASRGDGGFPLHFKMFLRFSQNCNLALEHCNVDVTAENVVLLLLKERESRGLWDRFWVGSDTDSLEEKLFLTTSNLQQQLLDLDSAAFSAEQTAGNDADSTECSPCDLEHLLEVTSMDEKKLTIKISPAVENNTFREEEDEEYDPPSSAEIEVVHTRPSPNLHSILKQHSVSESSEDISLDPESPHSPVEPEEDELSSSMGKRRFVSFNNHIDKATFQSSSSVSSMKTGLKNKRKRQRKWQEKQDKFNSRKQHNSTGSEGSNEDQSHSLSDSHSVSEEEVVAEAGDGQGDLKEAGNQAESKKSSEAEERSELNGIENNKDLGEVEELNKEHGNINSQSKPTSTEGESHQGSSLAQKIKSKLAETVNGDHRDDSDDEEEGDDDSEGKGSSWDVPDRSVSSIHNEHRTDCAFEFANNVMFDLDDE